MWAAVFTEILGTSQTFIMCFFEWSSYDSYERGSEMSGWWKYVEITQPARGIISNKAAVSAMIYALDIHKVGPFILGAVP